MTNSSEGYSYLSEEDQDRIHGFHRLLKRECSNQEVFEKFSWVAQRTLDNIEKGINTADYFCPVRPGDFSKAFPDLTSTLSVAGLINKHDFNPAFSANNKQNWKAVTNIDQYDLVIECGTKKVKAKFTPAQGKIVKLPEAILLSTMIGSAKKLAIDLVNYQNSSLEEALQHHSSREQFLRLAR